MASGFDGVPPVKSVVCDGAHVHEAARQVVNHVVEAGRSVQSFGLLQLDFTPVDSNDPDAGLPHDAAHRAADAATDVDYRHTLLQFQLGNHQPLVPNLGILQAFQG